MFDSLLGRASRLIQVCITSSYISEEQTEAVLRALNASTRLRRLNIGDKSRLTSLHLVGPDRLARAARWLEELNLQRTGVSAVQTEAFLRVITSKNNIMKSISLSDCAKLTFGRDLSGVSADLLARAATRLVSLNLSYIGLTSQQARAIFTVLCDLPSQLKCLVISDNDLSTVEPGLLA